MPRQGYTSTSLTDSTIKGLERLRYLRGQAESRPALIDALVSAELARLEGGKRHG